jgi:hypothetical protein
MMSLRLMLVLVVGMAESTQAGSQTWVGIDNNNDGIMDVVAVGADESGNGIPDALDGLGELATDKSLAPGPGYVFVGYGYCAKLETEDKTKESNPFFTYCEDKTAYNDNTHAKETKLTCEKACNEDQNCLGYSLVKDKCFQMYYEKNKQPAKVPKGFDECKTYNTWADGTKITSVQPALLDKLPMRCHAKKSSAPPNYWAPVPAPACDGNKNWVGIDHDNDGKMDVFAYGYDASGNGIPDALDGIGDSSPDAKLAPGLGYVFVGYGHCSTFQTEGDGADPYVNYNPQFSYCEDKKAFRENEIANNDKAKCEILCTADKHCLGYLIVKDQCAQLYYEKQNTPGKTAKVKDGFDECKSYKTWADGNKILTSKPWFINAESTRCHAKKASGPSNQWVPTDYSPKWTLASDLEGTLQPTSVPTSLAPTISPTTAPTTLPTSSFV